MNNYPLIDIDQNLIKIGDLLQVCFSKKVNPAIYAFLYENDIILVLNFKIRQYRDIITMENFSVHEIKFFTRKNKQNLCLKLCEPENLFKIISY